MLPGMSDASIGMTLAGVFLCEIAAALLVGAAGRPLAGSAFVGAALALAHRWLRLQRRRLETARLERLALARAEAQAEAAGGRTARAVEILEEARADALLDGPSARLLIELYASGDDLTSAVRLAIEHLAVLDPVDVRNMIASLESWDERQHASALAFAVTIRQTVWTLRGARGPFDELARAVSTSPRRRPR
jgi:membrane protein implicated in regulation of membrane protease activity